MVVEHGPSHQFLTSSQRIPTPPCISRVGAHKITIKMRLTFWMSRRCYALHRWMYCVVRTALAFIADPVIHMKRVGSFQGRDIQSKLQDSSVRGEFTRVFETRIRRGYTKISINIRPYRILCVLLTATTSKYESVASERLFTRKLNAWAVTMDERVEQEEPGV